MASDPRLGAALAAWGARGPVLVARRENAVWRAVLPDGRAIALRLHRDGYQSTAAIDSELRLCEALADAGFACPWPFPAADGALVVTLPDGRTRASALGWIEGAPLTAGPPCAGDAAGRYRAVGALLADFHLTADAVAPEPVDRPRWDAAALTLGGPWGDPLDDRDLTAEARDRMALSRRLAAERLAGVPAGASGIIHGDPLPDNILRGAAGLVLIDFDDSGSGFRLYDLATALIPEAGTPGAAAMAGALLDGYAGAGGVLPADAADLLALFLMLRAQASSAWARGRTPPGDPRRARYRQRAVNLTEGWLARA